MRDLVLDFESYYDKDLTLKKLSTSEYVRDPRFEVMGASVWWLNEVRGPLYLWPDELKSFLEGVDWANTRLICHNMLFDGFVMHTHYGHHPARYACTLAMSEAILKHVCRNGLTDVAQHLNVGKKIEGVLENLKGVRLNDLTPEQREDYAAYANEDCRLCGEIFKILDPQMVESERILMSITQRAFCDPTLDLDLPLIIEALQEADDERADAVAATGYTAEELSSNTRFVEILQTVLDEHDQLVPTKWSEKQEKMIPALAKSDEGMYWLREHDDPIVRTLAEGRLAVKSTIGRTRAQRMLTMATTGDCKFAVAYHYCRAHTDRWSGGNKINAQNFRRKSKLRQAIRAPEGYMFIAGDLSQIEPRMNAVLSGERWLVEAFRNGEDPYNLMASDIYNVEVDRHNGGPEHEDMGFLGKCAVIGLGYQMGAPTFKNTLAAGTLGPRKLIDLNFAQQVVQTYRRKNANIVHQWEEAENWIRYLCGGTKPLQQGRLVLDPKRNRIWMPNGTYLQYNGLVRGWDGAKYYERRGNAKIWKNLYGGKLIENVIQKLSRDVIADMVLAVDYRYRVVMTTHDELGTIVPKSGADEAFDMISAIMNTAPWWCPDVPVAAELKMKEYYPK